MGVYKAVGVFLPVLIVYIFGAETQNMVTVGYASLTIGIADQVGPFKHKRNELLIALFGTLIIAFIFAHFKGISIPFIFSLTFVIFFSNFLSCFGMKASTIGFTFIFIAMIAGRSTYDFKDYFIDFSFGAVFYVAYALIFAKFFEVYLIRQTLSNTYILLAKCLKKGSECYRQNCNLEEKFSELIESQTLLVAELQMSRDLLYRTRHKEDPRVIRMMEELVGLNDVYERFLSSYQDFLTIREHYPNSDIQIFFRDLYLKAADNLEEMGMYTLGGGEMIRRLGFKAELRALEYELEIIKNAKPIDDDLEAYQVLTAHYRRAWVLNRQLDRIRLLLLGEIAPSPSTEQFTKYVSRSFWTLDILKENLTLRSDYMRYAIRTSSAMFITLLFIHTVLEKSVVLGHSFWIAFTIVTLMRPWFSLTRERSRQRIKGTIVGCIVVGLLVSLNLNPLFFIGILFIAIILSNALGAVNYTLSVMCTTIYVLIVLNVDDKLSGLMIAAERIIDTGIAAVIAILFTTYFLPSWEKDEAPKLAEKIRQNIYGVLELIEKVWIKKEAEPYEFHLKLKSTQALIIRLSNSLTRMQKEPEKFHGNFHELNDFMIRQQSILAQLAILGFNLEQSKKDPADIPEFAELVMLTKMRIDPSIPSSENTKPYTAKELKPLIWMVENNV